MRAFYFCDNIVQRLHNFIMAHVKLVVTSDGDDCERKMDKIELKTIHRSGYLVLRNAIKQFNTANTAYHQPEAKQHDDINDTKCFIIYLDITKLYPAHMEYIDAIDWSKIYHTIQPKPTATTTSSADGAPRTDID